MSRNRAQAAIGRGGRDDVERDGSGAWIKIFVQNVQAFQIVQTVQIVLSKGKLFFKIGESTVEKYRRRKMKPFRPNTKQTLKSYYHVPVEIIEDADELRVWAMRAIQCQSKKT